MASTLTPVGFFGPTGQPLYRIDNAGHADDKSSPIGVVALGADGQPITSLGGGGGGQQVNIRRLTGIDDLVGSVPGQAGTATLSSVAASVTSVTLKAANSAAVGTSMGRMGLIVFNDSTTANLYLAYAATAAITATAPAGAFSYKIVPGQTWEMPSPLYGGLVSGIWDVASGNARITELTA
jgi:hypothetical protein